MMSSSDQFGTYDIEEVLGRGSMGVVYRARHELTHREVALKVLFPNVASTEMGEERFKREVRVSAMVDNEGIVDVFDAGEEEDEFFYAMELLDGRELSEFLPTYTWREGLACLVDVTASLAACHEAGIVHRDLKPDNIFVVGSGERAHTKLLDFGMASVRESPTATQTGFTLGTPAYMSPEQARDATEATPASDIWSIGVILYELIAGRLPFDGDSSTQVMLAVIEDEPPSIDPDAVDAPPRLVEIIDRCLQKDLEARFADAGQLHAALLEVYESLDDPPPLPSASQLDPTHPSQPSPVPETHSERPAVSLEDETDQQSTSADETDGTGEHARRAPNSAHDEDGGAKQWSVWILAFLGIVAMGTGLGLWVAPLVLPESESQTDSSKERAQPTTPDEREPSRDLQPDDIRQALAEARLRTERATLSGRASLRAMAVRSHTRAHLESHARDDSDSTDTQERIRPTFKAAPPPRGERKDSSSNPDRGSEQGQRRADESSGADEPQGAESTDTDSERQAQGAPAPEDGSRDSDTPQDEAAEQETSTVSSEGDDEASDESSPDEASPPEPPSGSSEDDDSPDPGPNSLPPVKADAPNDESPESSDSPSRAETTESDETGDNSESSDESTSTSDDSSSDAKESETTESKDDSSKSNTPAGDDKDEDKKRPPFSF